MPENNTENFKSVDRLALIKIIKTPLSYFVLIALMAELVLGTIAISNTGPMQELAIKLIVAVIIFLALVVLLIAVFKPGALLGNLNQINELAEFCKKIEGAWWQKATPGNTSSISFITINYSPVTNSLQMHGFTYMFDGERYARWDSDACAINIHTSKIFYRWEGNNFDTIGESHIGYGDMWFKGSEKQALTGDGKYISFNQKVASDINNKSTTLRRCTKREIEIMEGHDKQAISELVKNTYQNMA